jgi:hypothetical protein
VTHLRPKHSKVIPHDGGEVTVPIFDSKLMIMDLLTNLKCINTSIIDKGYDVFTGDVDESDISNKWYGEVHTGDAWLPQETDFALTMMKTLMTCPLD